MWCLALVVATEALQLTTGEEQDLRLRLGALPALWKLQTDVEALQGYLENPAKAFLQISGPDCECIGKTQGPDCECIGAKPKASLVSMKGPDCECIGKTQGPDCECIGAKPKASLVSKKGPDCECIGKTQGPDCECIGAKPTASLVSKKGPDCECIGKTQGPDCECIGAKPKASLVSKKGPDCECIGKTQGPDCECIGAKPKTSLVSKKGPDCECIGKTQGPDCECIGAKPKAALSKKGPDCECIGKTQGPDCECIGKAPAVLVSKPNSTAKSVPAAKTDKNATAAVDSETAELLKKAKSVDVKDMPMMLTILEAMYGRFKDNIKNANELEAKTKKHYEENMAKYKQRKAAHKDDHALDRMAEYWEKSRKLSHAHYHSMLKVAHAGMARLQMAIDMMTKAVNGQKLDKKELEHLKSVTPAPTVVLLQVRTDLLKFCKDALVELKAAKQMPSTSESKAPIGFLQIRQDPAPEDALAKEMTHDLEMNFNKIAPFGKEDTAKELQDHAADTQDTLVDAVENAEVAEIKRAVFRALTRLRAATIKEFDTIARLETQAIDAYNDAHHYRAENPLSHLHEDEAPVETDKLKSFH